VQTARIAQEKTKVEKSRKPRLFRDRARALAKRASTVWIALQAADCWACTRISILFAEPSARPSSCGNEKREL
jgi:hypothetical protein